MHAWLRTQITCFFGEGVGHLVYSWLYTRRSTHQRGKIRMPLVFPCTHAFPIHHHFPHRSRPLGIACVYLASSQYAGLRDDFLLPAVLNLWSTSFGYHLLSAYDIEVQSDRVRATTRRETRSIWQRCCARQAFWRF